MDITGAIFQRHSVRQYDERPIESEKAEAIQRLINECNAEGGLNIQLVLNEERAFGGLMARYGKFEGVKNYIALIGKKSKDLYQRLGYYGEKLVLFAQTLSLNTCWTALTYKKVKTAYTLGEGEKLGLVIAVGYGKTQGKPHKGKTYDKVAVAQNPPDWFIRGVEAALLAPTALNQQKFSFTLTGKNTVKAERSLGAYAAVDLGIVRCHFELAAGKDNFIWES